MNLSSSLRSSCFLLACVTFGMGPIACSDSDDTTAGDGDGDSMHDHNTPIDVSGDEAPSLSITAHEDGTSINLELEVDNFTFAPESASTDHVNGEGHAHLYVDGEKITRIYGEWFHVGGLSEGQHEIRVELSANSHNAFSVDGEIVDDTVTVDIPAAGEHKEHEMFMVDWEPVPSVEITVHEDPASGWNIEAVPSDFTLAPENVSGDHVDGEGHMHIYANDVKLGRLYTNWFHIKELPLGEVTLRVELSANDHRTLMFDGKMIDDSETITVEESDPHSHGDDDHSTDDHDDDHDTHGEGGADHH